MKERKKRLMIMQLCFVVGFIAFDILTGLLKAIKTKTFTSKKMKKGLWEKFTSILVMILAFGIVYGSKYIDIGVTIPPLLIQGVCSYIVIMEIASIIENIRIMYPKALPKFLTQIFEKGNDVE